MKYITLPISEEQKDQLISFYEDEKVEIKGDYLIFSAKHEDITIFIYSSSKGYKVVYQGENPLNEAQIFFKEASLNEPKKKEKTLFYDLSNQIGSDEVGTGDFFGPLIVTACYFSSQNQDLITTYKINDSKKLTDEIILETIPKIAPHVTFSQFTLHPLQYNELILKGWNMNQIKAFLHNKALLSISKKVHCNNGFIDQFCSPMQYFSYINNEKEIYKDLLFSTKGESHYPSIAIASMMARYSFLKEMEKMNETYQFSFPFGAGKRVDEAIQDFINKYHKEELTKVAKINFKNYKNID